MCDEFEHPQNAEEDYGVYFFGDNGPIFLNLNCPTGPVFAEHYSGVSLDLVMQKEQEAELCRQHLCKKGGR